LNALATSRMRTAASRQPAGRRRRRAWLPVILTPTRSRGADARRQVARSA
jgi:hypothetical protein